MIGKIARSGATFYGAFTYCRYEKANVNELKNPPIRGEIIHHQNIFSFVELEDRVLMKDIALEMEETASMNSRIKKPVSHMRFSLQLCENLRFLTNILVLFGVFRLS